MALIDSIQGIKKPQIARLIHRAGIERISGLVYEEVRGHLKAFLEGFMKKIVTLTDYYRKKTVSIDHVMMAMQSSLYMTVKDLPACSEKKKKPSVCLIFQKAPFQKLVREVAQYYKTDLSFQIEALISIQYFCEMYLTDLFLQSKLVMMDAKKDTLEPRDIQTARSINADRFYYG